MRTSQGINVDALPLLTVDITQCPVATSTTCASNRFRYGQQYLFDKAGKNSTLGARELYKDNY